MYNLKHTTSSYRILKSAAEGFEVTGILLLQIRNEFIISLTGAHLLVRDSSKVGEDRMN